MHRGGSETRSHLHSEGTVLVSISWCKRTWLNYVCTYFASTSDYNGGDSEVLGHLTMSVSSFTDRVNASLNPRVCRRGGDSVSIMATSEGPMGASEASTFTIMKKRVPNVAAETADAPATPDESDCGSVTYNGMPFDPAN